MVARSTDLWLKGEGTAPRDGHFSPRKTEWSVTYFVAYYVHRPVYACQRTKQSGSALSTGRRANLALTHYRTLELGKTTASCEGARGPSPQPALTGLVDIMTLSDSRRCRRPETRLRSLPLHPKGLPQLPTSPFERRAHYPGGS